MEDRHCIRCGEPVPAGSEYCPTCGASADGTACDRTASFYADRRGFGKKEDTMGSVPTLILVYGVLALVAGIVVVVSSQGLESAWGQLADADGLYYGLTMAETSSALLFTGIPLVVSGACALVSGLLSKRRASYNLALGLCILAAIDPLLMAIGLVNMVVFGIVLCVIGLVMCNKIYVNRDSFSS